MAKKSDKLDLKFRLAVDVKNIYLFNGFPYVGKDVTQNPDVSLPSNVMLKRVAPFQRDYKVTGENFFASLDLALRLSNQQSCLVGTMY